MQIILFILLCSWLHAADYSELTQQQRHSIAVKLLSHTANRNYNPEQARLLLEENARLLYQPSILLLSSLYLSGTGGVKNIAYSMGWLHYLSGEGNHMADAELARRYQEGIGIKPNKESAYYFAQRAMQDPSVVEMARLWRGYKKTSSQPQLNRSKSSPAILTKRPDVIKLPPIDLSLPKLLVTYGETITLRQKKIKKPKKTKPLKEPVQITSVHTPKESVEEKIAKAQNLIASSNADDFSKGVELLKNLENQDKASLAILAKAYVKKPFKLSKSQASQVYIKLFQLAKSENDMAVVKECLDWSIIGKHGVEQNLTHAEELAQKLNKKDQMRAYKKIALAYWDKKNFKKSCDVWKQLRSVVASPNDSLYSEATSYLAVGYAKHKYASTTLEEAALWMQSYDKNQQKFKTLVLEQNDLALCLRDLALKFYKQDPTANYNQAFSLVKRAHELGSLKATNDYVFLLFEDKNHQEALKIIHQHLPSHKVENSFTLLNDHDQDLITDPKEFKTLALLAAEHFSPENNDHTDQNLFMNYLAYAARSGKIRAFTDLGYYLLTGKMGFSKNEKLGLELLKKVPKTHKFYGDVLISFAIYYVATGQFDGAEKSILSFLSLEKKMERWDDRLLDLAQKLMTAQQYHHAKNVLLKTLQQIEKKSSNYLEGLIYLGHSKFMLGDLDNTLKSFKELAESNSAFGIFNTFIIENFLFKTKTIEMMPIERLMHNAPDFLKEEINSPYLISPFHNVPQKNRGYFDRAARIKFVTDISRLNSRHISMQPFLNFAIDRLKKEKGKVETSDSNNKQNILKDMEDAILLLETDILQKIQSDKNT